MSKGQRAQPLLRGDRSWPNSFHDRGASYRCRHQCNRSSSLPVRLAAGLTEDGGLSSEAQERALSCPTQFGQRLRDLPSEQVRAVGTNALRQAKKAETFGASRESFGASNRDHTRGRGSATHLSRCKPQYRR